MQELITDSGNLFRYLSLGSGHPVVFVHGLPGQASDFLPLMQRLEKEFLCIAYNRLGYGGACAAESTSPVERNVGELIEFLDLMGLETVSLAGWSFGAQIATDTAAVFPDRVSSLILLGGAGPTFRWPGSLADKVLFRTPFGNGILKLLRALGAASLRGGLNDAYGGPAPPRLLESFHASLYDQGMIETWLHEGRHWDPATSNAALVNQPTLILHGDADSRIPSTVATQLSDLIADSRLKVLLGAGHWPFYSHPEQTAEECMSFLRAVTA